MKLWFKWKTHIHNIKGIKNAPPPILYTSHLGTTPRRPCRPHTRSPLILLPRLSVRQPQYHPIAQEFAQYRSQNDTNEDVPIVVHNKQHNNISQRKRRSMNHRSNKLLQRGSSERRVLQAAEGV
jgi:hypothetical protein